MRPAIDPSGLPPRSVPGPLPSGRSPPGCGPNLRIGNLPPGLGRMPEAFVKAGYNVITINALRKWDIVGPTASLYPPEEVKEADDYLREYVSLVHGAGAKAIFYIGPVQVPVFNPAFVKPHPDWLRIRPDGKPDAEPELRQHPQRVRRLAARAARLRDPRVQGRRVLVRRLRPGPPAHLRRRDPERPSASSPAARRSRRRCRTCRTARCSSTRSTTRRPGGTWPGTRTTSSISPTGCGRRSAGENPEAVIFVNHSANRTWYFPETYMGEYPLHYAGAVDVSSVELYWDVPGDSALPAVRLRLHAGDHPRTRARPVWIQPSAHGISGVSSPVEIQLRGLEGTPWGVYPGVRRVDRPRGVLKLHAGEHEGPRGVVGRSPSRSPTSASSPPSRRGTLYARGACRSTSRTRWGRSGRYLEKHVPGPAC